MENKTYIFYEDLDRLGLKESDFSSCSYKEHVFFPTYYLEEDCDLGVFVLAYKEKFGRLPNFKQKYQENCHIRHYQNYDYKEAA